jgi:hypothetical protein
MGEKRWIFGKSWTQIAHHCKQAQPFSEAFPQLEKVPAILHEIQSHSEHYNLPTRLIKMGRGGKRVRDW